MKRILVIGLLIAALCPIAAAQNTIYFYYDGTGNRVQRHNDHLARTIPSFLTTSDSLQKKSNIFSESSNYCSTADWVAMDSIVSSDPFKTQETDKLDIHKNRRQANGYEARALLRSVNWEDYAPGEIPYQATVSPTGARIYSVPVMTSPSASYAPQISLVYSSQAGNGVAGYGWSIGGLSAITITNKNLYYHDTVAPADKNKSDQVYALDGNPIVPVGSNDIDSFYEYETAQGHILINANRTSSGIIKCFTAYYPDGSVATFGYNNTVRLTTYPMTSFEDKFGFIVKYHYTHTSSPYEKHEVSYIEYKHKNDPDYIGKIVFNYEGNREDCLINNYAGSKFCQDRLLKSILSYDSGNLLRQYTLNHTFRSGVNLLSEIECRSQLNGKSLRPLKFQYGDLNFSSGTPSKYFTQNQTMFLSQYFPSDSVYVISYQRGKFLSGSYSDGILMYPIMDKLVPNQEILVVPEISTFSNVCHGLTFGEGFLQAVPLDVDGDGVSEIVKINYKDFTTTTTTIKIGVYSCNPLSSKVFLKYDFDVIVNGVSFYGDDILPTALYCAFGNFSGDGKAQILAISYNEGQTIAPPHTSISVIDVANQMELSESTLFSFDSPSEVLCADIDGDGKTELCHVDGSDIEIYNLSGNTFTLTKTLWQDAYILSKKYLIGNTNGDGYIDLVVLPNDEDPYFQIFSYNGQSFDYSEALSASETSEDDKYTLYDVNNDGLDDIIQRCSTSTYVNLNSHGTFSTTDRVISNLSFSSDVDFIPSNIIDYDSSSDFFTVENGYIRRYSFSEDASYNRLLTLFVNSFGRTTKNVYEDMVSSRNVYPDDSQRTYDSSEGYYKSSFPIYLLYESVGYLHEDMVQWEIVEEMQYSYYDACFHSRGLGFCGFGKIRTIDLTGTVNKEPTVTEIKDPEKNGVTIRVENALRLYQSTPYQISTHTYDDNLTTHGISNPRLIETYSRDNLTSTYTLSRYSYDEYDFPTDVSVIKYNDTDELSETQEIVYSHQVGATSQILGTVESVIKTCSRDDESWIEKQEFSSFNTKMQPSVAVSFVGADLSSLKQVSKNEYVYDSYGHVVTEKNYLFNSLVPSQTSCAYSTDKISVTSSTDEFGHTTTYGDFNKYRQPGTITDYKGRVTRNSYDSWGNLTSRTYPDGSIDSTLVQWGGDGAYTVTTTSSGQPSQIVHYDSVGRNLKSGTECLTGEWIYKNTEYNENGTVYRESLPYKSTGSATLWNMYAYDNYQRPVSYTQASGNVTTWAYNLNSTTESKNGIWSKRTVDPAGNLIKVQDDGGTITYSYRADGNPSTVTVTGGLPTTFSYDEYGRRSSIIDCSAGTQTDTTSYDSNGCSLSIHSHPNETIKTYRDRFGRTTKVERYGFYAAEYNTEYTYNSDGLLIEEESTNGTSKTYTYDSYDRIATVTEVVPDGKWLRKEYTYNTGGNILSITYVSQSGWIDTEYFSYRNGCNYMVTNAQGATIRQINAVNEFGQPTSVRTGTINRTYSYTPYGMPTGRTMGNVMDMSYDFDVSTGNLTYREDNIQMCYEEFYYDSLNRLEYMDADMRTVTYSQHGNLTRIDGVGDLEYDDSQHPYQATSLSMEEDVLPTRIQNVSYTSYSRPSYLNEGNRTARLTYNGDGDRVKMNIADGVNTMLSRYYIGNQYEIDVKPSGTVERLYLGGDAYSAPMVYIKEGDGEWEMYNIGRDYLGSITHIATSNGTLIEENSYDPWGRLRIPGTTTVYPFGSEPELMLGRGYTGHEHLTWFGVINMNARLYDPVLGRFLSPDPFVQTPDFTQNFNRYSYCLNNPLKFVDENGEICGTTMLIVGGICAAVFGAGNLAAHAIRGDDLGQGNWAKYFFSGALAGFAVGSVGYAAFAGASAMASSSIGLVRGLGKAAAFGMKWLPTATTGVNFLGSAANGIFNQNDQWFNNFAKSVIGNFYLDENKSFGGQLWEGISRFTWEYPQQMVGYAYSSIRNIWSERVDLWGGATFITNANQTEADGITLGSYININSWDSNADINSYGSFDSYMQSSEPMVKRFYAHEYGHVVQSKKWGIGYLGIPGLFSLINCRDNARTPHGDFWTETYANAYARDYYQKYHPSFKWDYTNCKTKY